jgi:hypothetical protein
MPQLKLEDLRPKAVVRGILPDALVTVVSVAWHGSDALTLVYRGPNGRVADEILYRHDEPRLEIVEAGRPWSFDGDGALFRLVSEAHRIRLAHLFDPVLAVHTSLVEPLPHQITAVYEAMLPRQPLRFLLADDPGAGKTIMAGLFIKELIARGDLKRCLVVCPGSLAEQWQDELHRRFHLPFEILTNDKLEAARTGNWFLENDLAIARLDKLSRNEDVQQKLSASDCRYDLIVCDEAHKLSATFFGGEVKYTKRYRLGQLLSGLTRHFLLMTATPHNGIGPSMGGARPTEPVEPGGANRPHRDPMQIGADVMNFDWGDSRKTRWSRLCSDMLGGEQYVSALTALLNLDWRHSTRESEIPQEDLSNGLNHYVWPLLSELQPRIVCSLTNRVWETILPKVQGLQVSFPRCPIRLPREPFVFELPRSQFRTLLVKSHNHPSRPLRRDQMAELGRACRWFLNEVAEGTRRALQ